MNKLKEQLEEIGCKKPEIETFSLLLKYPNGISALSLSRGLNLPRPTVYSHLVTLIQMGLAKKGISGGGSIFYPENLDNILMIFDEKILLLKTSKEEMMQSLSVVDNKTKYKPRFFIFEGPNTYENIMRDILHTREEAFFIWPIENSVLRIPEKQFLHFQQERIRRGIWINSLWPEKMKNDMHKNSFLNLKNEDESLRRVRLLPKSIEQKAGYGIYGSQVVFMSGQEDYSFIVESKELAETLKTQFDFLWSVSRKPRE